MKNFWKQFAAWGIGSEDNEFIRARLKLTAWYLLSLAAIVAIFSIVLYWIFSHEIRENIERTFTEEQYKATDEIVIVKTTTELQRLILIIDAFILMAAGGLSWLLAGRTLIPIRKALEAQRQFSADASHELRTPLAIM